MNSKIKAVNMKREVFRNSMQYAAMCKGVAYDSASVKNRVMARLAERGVIPTPKPKLRIFWVGTDWEQDNSGFLQALNNVGEVRYFVNGDGKYGVRSTGGKPDTGRRKEVGNALTHQLEHVQKTEGQIDLLLGQMLGRNIPVEALSRAQQMGMVTANISMDDRLPELWTKHEGTLLGGGGLADGLDLTLTTSPECCVRYEFLGCPALYWPLASDPSLFKSAAVKDIDVSFIGNNYGARGAIVRELQKAGIQVAAYGAGWPNGSVNAAEAARIFGRSKIILGIGTIGHSEDLFTLKLRDFDATMAGSLYITHRNPDLLEIFSEGEEIECYLTEREAVRKIKYYLSNPEPRARIAGAAAQKARLHHTWDTRIETALATLGLRH
jgi:glycosyltransferase involved in cell wall biosynthesis